MQEQSMVQGITLRGTIEQCRHLPDEFIEVGPGTGGALVLSAISAITRLASPARLRSASRSFAARSTSPVSRYRARSAEAVIRHVARSRSTAQWLVVSVNVV